MQSCGSEFEVSAKLSNPGSTGAASTAEEDIERGIVLQQQQQWKGLSSYQ
jgi:hypothetical protein